MKLPDNPREVLTFEPLNLQGYELFGNRVMLALTTEETLKRKIQYKGLNQGDFFEVVAVGTGVKGRGIEIGDFIMINPDLPPNQIPFVYVEMHKLMIVEFHEVFIIRKPDYVSSLIPTTENG